MEEKVQGKKRWYKRWWIWVLAVVVLFIIIAASGDSSPEKVGSNQEGGSVQSTAEEQPETFKVGDQIKLGNSVITVNDVEYSQGGQYTHPSEGNEWVNLSITIENTGSSQQYVTTLGQMYIRDNEGNSYQVAVTNKSFENPGFGLDGAVIAKSKRTGWVGFEIRKAAKGLQFQYNGSIFGGGTILVDLGR